ncbi:hypothetical protein EMIT053CA3_310024 [Pseudomonas donghuensis]|uniref:gp53-like domain-containing protein n=1 Tax=Pseudomonas donghuensis TaxID=1163398 RepID=UPI0039DF4FE3
MDFPKTTPGVGLVNGKFADENPSTGQIGSLIPAAWGNAVTQEILNVIAAAGMAANEGDLSQLLKAIQTITATDSKRSVRCATTGPIALSGLQTIDGVALAANDRVLVKNQASAAQNWIYTVAAGAWVRAQDANESIECIPGHLVPVQSGTLNGGTSWQLTNTTPPTLGTTALTFALAQGKTGIAPGAYKNVTVDAFGRVVEGSNPTTVAGFGITDANTKTEVASAIQTAVDGIVNGAPGLLNQLNKIAAAIGNDANFAGTMANALAGKAGKATTLAGYGIADAFTKVAVTSAIQAAVDGIVNGAPGLLNQLNKIANAIDNDPNFAGTMVNALASKAPLANPNLTGTVTVPTAAPGSNNGQAASTAFVRAAIAALIGSSPAALDTLKELADALGNDPNFATTMTNALAGKAAKATTLDGYGITDGLKTRSDQFPAFFSKTAGMNYTDGAIQIREMGMVGNAQSGIDFAPAIVFHWTNRIFKHLFMSAGGDLFWGPTGKVLHTDNMGPMLYALMGANNEAAVRNVLGITNTSNFGGGGGWWRDGQTGLMIQYGTILAQAESVYGASFPTAFPNFCLMVIPATLNGATGDDDVFARVISWTRQNASLKAEYGTGNGHSPAARNIAYIAIGY